MNNRCFNKLIKTINTLSTENKRKLLGMVLLQDTAEKNDGCTGEDITIHMQDVDIDLSYDIKIKEQ